MPKKPSKLLTPRTARSNAELCSMPRDNVTAGDFWMLTDGYEITFANQKSGEMPKAKVSIPRHVFDAFVDWYMSGVWKKPRKVA